MLPAERRKMSDIKSKLIEPQREPEASREKAPAHGSAQRRRGYTQVMSDKVIFDYHYGRESSQ